MPHQLLHRHLLPRALIGLIYESRTVFVHIGQDMPVDVVTISLAAGIEQEFPASVHHIFGLAPDHPTTTPMSNGGKLIDVEWAPGSVGYLPPGMAVSATIIEQATSTYVTIPDRIFHTAAFESIDVNKVDFRWIPTAVDPVSANLIRAMSSLSQTVHANDMPLVAESVATALAMRTLQNLGGVQKVADLPYPSGLPRDRLRMVLDYIDDNISRPLHLAELAGVLHLSTFHFARAFKQAMNVAPIKYVWQRRVDRAKEALRQRDVQMVAVAYECGFSSQSHFATSFKQFTGMTPTAFRAAISTLVPGWLAAKTMKWIFAVEMAIAA